MGELLRKARLEAGLTQRALCGDWITRNMLSQIENGTARPSMATLQYLADALGKPVSYFLGEVVLTANQQRMLQARQAFAEKRYRAALSILGDCETPDETLDWERGLLGCLCCLSLAEEAAREGRRPVARKLLGQARRFESPYITPDLRTRQELLAQQLGQKPRQKQLPSLDGELLLRADNASVRRIPGFPVAIVDTIGSGDAHTGGVIAGLMCGLPIDECVLLANRVASVVTGREGGACAPTIDELLTEHC